MSEFADRYARQLVLKVVGPEGQARLAGSSALVVGCGALGTAQADRLVRAGVGTVRLVDRDQVELSNLQRQLLFTEADARSRLPKAVAAAQHLRAINASVTVDERVADVVAGSIRGLIDGVDVVLDATDNFETRYLINDACVEAGVPWIYGGVVATSGMLMPVLPGRGPCLRCLFPDPPEPGSVPDPAVEGVLNTAPTVVASWQVTMALQILLGDQPEPALISIDLWRGRQQRLPVQRASRCPCCVERRFCFVDAEDSE
jgi:molybdopterin-synthase adenylyltransferase